MACIGRVVVKAGSCPWSKGAARLSEWSPESDACCL